MKKLHTLVAVVGIAVAAGAAYWFQHRPTSAVVASAGKSAPGSPAGGAPAGNAGPVTVEVGKVVTMSLRDEALAVGTLRSRQGVMLRPEVSGRIARLGFSDGQRVRRGQVLVQLDATLQKAQLLQAQAQASIARTNLQRNRDLMAQNFVSQSAADQSAAALEVAEAQVALAQAQLNRMSIVAPFDGVTGIRNVNVGDYVKDGADLVNIEDLSAMLVDFRLPERVISRLKPRQSVDVSLDGLANRTFKARVEAVDSQLDTNGRSLLVRALIEDPQGALRTGMYARTRVVFETRDAALVVPEEAVVPQGAKQYLIKVVDGPSGKVSQRIEARLGMRVAGKVEVLEGFAANDLVVTAGHARLMRGESQALKVVEVGGGGGGGGASKPEGATGRPGSAPLAPAAARASSAV